MSEKKGKSGNRGRRASGVKKGLHRRRKEKERCLKKLLKCGGGSSYGDLWEVRRRGEGMRI